jgi:hypothetical protein
VVSVCHSHCGSARLQIVPIRKSLFVGRIEVAVISNIRVYRLEISIPAVPFLLSSSREKLMDASTEAFEHTIRKNTEIELIGLSQSSLRDLILDFYPFAFPAFRFASCRAKYNRRSAAKAAEHAVTKSPAILRTPRN